MTDAPRRRETAIDYQLRVIRENDALMRKSLLPVLNGIEKAIMSSGLRSSIDDLMNGPFRDVQKTLMSPQMLSLQREILKTQEAQAAKITSMFAKMDFGAITRPVEVLSPQLVESVAGFVDEVGEATLPDGQEDESEIVDVLIEPAVQFVAEHGAGMSPEQQERLFVSCIRALVFLILLSAVFAGEASKEVVAVGAPALEIAISSQIGGPARSAWRRWRSAERDKQIDD